MLYFSSHLLTSFYRITDLCMILSQDREQDVRHETETVKDSTSFFFVNKLFIVRE